jgi:hypothetical protein
MKSAKIRSPRLTTQSTQNFPFKPSKQDKHNIKKSMNQNDDIAGKTVT